LNAHHVQIPKTSSESFLGGELVGARWVLIETTDALFEGRGFRIEATHALFEARDLRIEARSSFK